jgi:hypothetical protein
MGLFNKNSNELPPPDHERINQAFESPRAKQALARQAFHDFVDGQLLEADLGMTTREQAMENIRTARSLILGEYATQETHDV